MRTRSSNFIIYNIHKQDTNVAEMVMSMNCGKQNMKLN